jgi:Lon-like protease
MTSMTPTLPPRRSRRRFVLPVVVAVVLLGLNGPKLQQYQIVPGSATPLAPLLTVSGVATAKPVQGRGISMVDVGLNQLTPWGWLKVQMFGGDTVSASDLVPSGVPVAQFDNQSYLDMANAKLAASVVAARQVGWTVPATPRGAEVEFMAYPSPAQRAGLGIGDWIEAVDGQPVQSACGLIAVMTKTAPGTAVTLTVQRARITDAGAITRSGTPTVVHLTTVKPTTLNLDTPTSSGCPNVSTAPRSALGVYVNDAVTYRLPMTVKVNTSYIGGPSAGLAMTLALIDSLTGGRLTTGHHVAVTGAMNAAGRVGDVGGVAEKTTAAIQSGNTIFLVPSSEVTVARQAADGKLTVVGVDTIRQALRALQHLTGASLVPLTKPTLASVSP